MLYCQMRTFCSSFLLGNRKPFASVFLQLIALIVLAVPENERLALMEISVRRLVHESPKTNKVFFLLILPLLLILVCRSPIDCTQFTEEDAQWADDQASPDIHHLNASFSEIPFDFSSADLREWVTKNFFSLSEGQDEVLFALRGCQIANNKQGLFSDSVQLQELSPNHKDYKDVLGMWRQSSDKLAVFEGSTVPNWYYMCIQAEMGGHQANMLPTGRYLY